MRQNIASRASQLGNSPSQAASGRSTAALVTKAAADKHATGTTATEGHRETKLDCQLAVHITLHMLTMTC